MKIIFFDSIVILTGEGLFMASLDQKLRTLYLMDIMLERTDDNHMLNASQLCSILEQEHSITTDRRTIYTEMEILKKYGLDIQQKKGKNPGYYNVDYIHTAIHDNKEIAFQYAEWTMKKEFHLKKDGAFYLVSPWALTWDDENYYLVAYDDVAGKIKHYRVDKMKHMKVLETDRKGEVSFRNFDLAAFSKKTFGMYGGHDVWLIPMDENHFRTHVTVSVSPQFFGWVTGIGRNMRIEGPEHVKQKYKEYLQGVLENY